MGIELVYKRSFWLSLKIESNMPDIVVFDTMYPLPLVWTITVETESSHLRGILILNDELAILFAKRFIQRRDVKAVQFKSGAYVPDFQLKNRITGEPDPGKFGPLGFKMNHLQEHLEGAASYGHYILDADSNARFFCFDIDLEQEGFWVPIEPWVDGMDEKEWESKQVPIECNPRDLWRDRASPARGWFKIQFGTLARKFVSAIQRELEIPCAAAYSGNKGIHVYGFTGTQPAATVRQAAIHVLNSMDDWELYKGQHFFRSKLRDPYLGYPNISIEVYPKQDSLDGKDLGNLLRLPLGRNLKSPDPTFFLDLSTPVGVMAPHPNPVELLENGDPYEAPLAQL